MFSYQTSPLREERLQQGVCRCGSNSEGLVYNLTALVNNGRISDPHAPNQNLSTPEVIRSYDDPPPVGSGPGRTLIFAVNSEYEVRVAPDGVRPLVGAVKHETLFHNADVLAAGEIHIRDGIIAGVNDHSASYGTLGRLETDPAFSDALLQAFAINNLPVEPALIEELRR